MIVKSVATWMKGKGIRKRKERKKKKRGSERSEPKSEPERGRGPAVERRLRRSGAVIAVHSCNSGGATAPHGPSIRNRGGKDLVKGRDWDGPSGTGEVKIS